MASTDFELFQYLFQSGWVSDGIQLNEAEALEILSEIAQEDLGLAVTASRFGWLGGPSAIADGELRVLQILRSLARQPGLAQQVASMSWLSNAISNDEVVALEVINSLANNSSSLPAQLLRMAWFSDAISAEEKAALESLDAVARKDLSVAANIAGMGWF